MIIKSLGRKASSTITGAFNRGQSVFSKLLRYMNRDLETGDGEPLVWHNLYGDAQTPEAELKRLFEDNAQHLRARKGGNALYHEILSLSHGHTLDRATLLRYVTDIAQSYLHARAPNQMAYGVAHLDTEHTHIHLIISANEVGKPDRVRLSKKEFADIQKDIERQTLERYPDLAQTRIYTQERNPEKIKGERDEQAMKSRTGEASRKDAITAALHYLFETSQTAAQMAATCKEKGYVFYERGKSIGIKVREPDGTERRHRLETLGLKVHYLTTLERLQAVDRAVPVSPPQPQPLEQEIADLLAKKVPEKERHKSVERER